MIRFKHFAGSGPELEGQINSWLTALEPDITHMTQTVQDGTVLVSFVFEESFRAQEIRISEERGMKNAGTPAVPVDTIPDRPIVVPQEPGQFTSDLR